MKVIAKIIFLPFILTVHCVPFVQIDSGVIEGRTTLTPNNVIYYAFQEIPYAAPPIGNLRFRPPQPVTRWNGIRKTTQNTKICYQYTFDTYLENEDCLYLNVYIPKLPVSIKDPLLPVMFHLHGGGFGFGDGTFASFGPDFLIEKDVVVVVINYRLGPFGFLSTEDEVIPGNNGLRDQMFALKWVNRNIRYFGGNPSAVTFLGQLAGAASVTYHLLNPESEGLFRAAVLQSGSALCPFGYQRNPRLYAYQTALKIDPLFNTASSSKDLLRFLLNVPGSELDQASFSVISSESYNTSFSMHGIFYAPVLEVNGKDGFVVDHMYQAIKAGKGLRVPIMIGITSEEFLTAKTEEAAIKQRIVPYDNEPQWLVPSSMNIRGSKDLVGRQIRKIYTDRGLLQDSAGLALRFLSDASINRGTIAHAFLQKSFSDVYFYQFSYDGALGHSSAYIPGAEHVGHDGELPYLWRMNSSIANNYDLSQFSDQDLATQERLVLLWTNFAKTLNPTPTADKVLQHIIWPKASAFGPNDLPYLDIRRDLQIRNNPKSPYFSAWSNLFNSYGNPPFDTY